jgi:cytochrome c-type biogenesis protein CcmH
MKRWWSILLLVLAMQLASSVSGKEAAPLAADEATEKRLVAITQELRCLVCQNESIADSQADLANDLRDEVREMIRAGKSDKEIIDFMVARYGDFVRYRPPVKPTTWLLWGGPFLLLVGGVGALVLFLRRRGRAGSALTAELTAAQRREAAVLLDNSRES